MLDLSDIVDTVSALGALSEVNDIVSSIADPDTYANFQGMVAILTNMLQSYASC